jgi:hypothetical protein
VNVHKRGDREGLPAWLTTGVVIWLCAMMTYTTIRFGLDGYPFTMFFGGLLGAYHGIDRAVRREQRRRHDDSSGGGDS